MRSRSLRTCVLCLCLLLVPFSAQAQTRLMVASDLHYINPILFEEDGALEPSARYGDGKMPHRSADFLAGLVLETIAVAPDALVLLGDQTYNGEVMSHRGVSDALAEIEAAGIPVYVIAGNHDINNDQAFAYEQQETKAVHSIPLSRYDKYYGAYGRDQAFSTDAASLSYAVALRDGLWLLMLDAGIYEPFAEVFGLIERFTQDWLEGLLKQAQAEGIQVLTATHQSLLPHSETVNAGYMVINWQEIVPLLSGYGVRLNMSGHIHIQHIAEQDGFYDAALSSLSNQPNQYALVTIEDDGAIEYQTQSLAAAHLPEGLSEEAIAYFEQASHHKAFKALRDSGLADAEREEMAAYAAYINRHFYAGTTHLIQKEAFENPLYTCWQIYGNDTFWAGYLREMLTNPIDDMTHLSLEAIR